MEKNTPTTRARSPNTIAMDPANARSTIIMRNGMKNLSEISKQTKKLFSLLNGL